MFVWFRGSFKTFLVLTAVFHCQLQLVVTVDQIVLQAWRIRSSLIFCRYRKSAWNSMNMTISFCFIANRCPFTFWILLINHQFVSIIGPSNWWRKYRCLVDWPQCKACSANQARVFARQPSRVAWLRAWDFVASQARQFYLETETWIWRYFTNLNRWWGVYNCFLDWLVVLNIDCSH